MKTPKKRASHMAQAFGIKGFSLVEVMVAVGITGILSLVVAQMMKNQNEVMTHSEAKGEELEIYSQIRTVLARKDACEATFKGSSMGDQLSVIRNSSTNIVFEVGNTYGNRALKLDGLILKNQNIPTSGGLGEAILEIKTTRLKKDNGQKEMTREIMLQVNADASGTVIECYSQINNTIETAKAEMCEAIKGIYDPSTGLCDLNCISAPGVSNEAISSECLDTSLANERQISNNSYVNVGGDTMTGKLDVQADIQTENLLSDNKICIGSNCRSTFANQACATGQVVSKVNSNGTLECANITCPSQDEFFVGISASGDVLCKPFPTETCPADHYVKKVHNDGSVHCEEVPESEKVSGQDCPSGQMVSGIDTNGNLKCEPDITGKSCPNGQVMRGEFKIMGTLSANQMESL